MFKKFNFNQKGGIATETIIVIAVILTAAIIGFYYLFIKIDKSQSDMEKGLTENYTDKDLVINVTAPEIEIDDDEIIDDTTDGNGLLTDESDELKKVTFSQSLEKNTNDKRELTITLPNIESLIDLRVSNSGNIEVINIDGDEITIRIANGNPVEHIIVSGEYIPSSEKYITAYPTPNYIDENGYKGTLTRYVYQTIPSETKSIETFLESDTTSFPNTQTYSEGEYSTTLSKSGTPIATVIKGSALQNKFVTKQESPDYVENLNDNQIETAYTGTLSIYVDSGADVMTKTATHIIKNKSSENDVFPETFEYSDAQGFTGTLIKTGNPVSVVDEGSNLTNKFVTNQPTEDYIEHLNDNGIETTYTGTLTQYVHQGSDTNTKFVTNQPTEGYSEYINDNGVGIYYTGTLTQYVHSGFAPDSKTHSQIVTSSNTNFADTINTADGLYNGAIGKNGSYRTYTGGFAPVSKYVSGQSSSWYNDGSYSGSLSSYLAGGSASDSKYVSGQSSSWYNDGSYSGSLSSYLAGGEAGGSMYVTGQYSSYYNSGGYSGSLSSYLASGSASQRVSGSYSNCYNDVRVSYNNRGHVSSRTPIAECPMTATIWATIDGSTYYGTGYKSAYATRKCGETGYPNATCTENWVAEYPGTVSKPDTRVYLYQGTVYKPDTRYYLYAGTVYKPDTRYYLYAGTVWTADTRYTYYEQTYTGTIYRPDSRVYRYQGNVTKPDTRIYRFQGTVTKPDTRTYIYDQYYTGTVKTEDTRIWKYQGNVTKPDTRVYKYTQYYKGTLYIPERYIYRYQGKVIRDAVDNRQIDYYYQYDFEIDYYEKSQK